MGGIHHKKRNGSYSSENVSEDLYFFLAVPLTWGFIGAQRGGQVASEAGELKAQAGACDSSSAGRNGCFWRFFFLRKKATWSLGVDFFLKIL